MSETPFLIDLQLAIFFLYQSPQLNKTKILQKQGLFATHL